MHFWLYGSGYIYFYGDVFMANVEKITMYDDDYIMWLFEQNLIVHHIQQDERLEELALLTHTLIKVRMSNSNPILSYTEFCLIRDVNRIIDGVITPYDDKHVLYGSKYRKP